MYTLFGDVYFMMNLDSLHWYKSHVEPNFYNPLGMRQGVFCHAKKRTGEIGGEEDGSHE